MIKKTAVCLVAVLSIHTMANAQLVISDNYDVTGSGTGFGANAGVNSGINPPTTTRLTGTPGADLMYLATDATKAASSYSITGGKLQVNAAASSGRFSLTADGSTAYNFSSVLGADIASAANPSMYDITINMDNDSGGTQRFSFALGTAENNANFWDFGIQLYRAAAANNFYTIGKRIDQVSYTTATDSTGTTRDINAAITTTGSGTFGTELSFLIRVTDAGAESSTFNSRVQVSTDGGSTWIYDTSTDPLLSSTGFRFDSTNRFFMWDIANNTAAKYDNFSVTVTSAPVPEPSVIALGLVGGVALFGYRRRMAKTILQ